MRKDELRLIDIHAHILPGIDDGAKDMETTRRMLAMAWAEGIRTIIATPHYYPGRTKTTAEEIRVLAKEVQREAAAIHPDFRIFCGNEIYYTDSAVEEVKEGNILTLAESSYVLTEFYTGVSFKECERAVRKFTAARYQPVIAHAERYACLRRKGALEELIHGGALVQVNFESLLGSVFDPTYRWVKGHLKEGNLSFFGTDMHNMGNRSPKIGKAVKALRHLAKPEELEELLWENPGRVLEDEEL